MKILEYKLTFLYFNCNIRKRKGRLAPPPCAWFLVWCIWCFAWRTWCFLWRTLCFALRTCFFIGVLGVWFGVFGILGVFWHTWSFVWRIWFGVLLGVLGVFWRTLVYCVLGILVSIIGVFVIGILYLLHLEFELVYLMFSSLKTCIFMFVFPEEIC